MDGNLSSGTPVQAGTGTPTGQQGHRKSSGSEAEEDADSDESSSSSPKHVENVELPSPQSALDNFRREWEAELKTVSGNSNVNSVLNLVSVSPASLANPYPNPTSMAGAVSKSKSQEKGHHPFATGGIQGQGNSQIQGDIANPTTPSDPGSILTTGSIEDQARRWFLQGIGFEKHGDLYDAVRCYRRAIQLVPDIEYKISQGLAGSKKDEEDSDESEDSSSESEADEFKIGAEQSSEEDPVLMRRFLKQIEQKGWIFFEKNSKSDKKHFGDFPVEVVSYLLRWVVSSELDIRSLEVLSTVCKGFYCISRDEKVWKMACERVWESCVLGPSYSSFREMFLNRPRVRLDGCYISKITYIRPGEHSFQDQFYRPWHFVEYYRYIRFFPDGHVHFLTTSEEPTATVPGLRDKNPRNQATLKGKYQLYGNNIVTAMVKKPPTTTTISGFSKAKRQDIQEQTSFHIEFEICPIKGRNNWMLKWAHHAAFISKTVIPRRNNFERKNNNGNGNTNTTVTSTTFDLCSTKYPPLLFSRVKSYTTRSESILE